jgi:hypothetical protein
MLTFTRLQPCISIFPEHRDVIADPNGFRNSTASICTVTEPYNATGIAHDQFVPKLRPVYLFKSSVSFDATGGTMTHKWNSID